MARLTGQVVQILGGVVDVEFPVGQLPNIYDALEVPREGKLPLVLEVQKHLGNKWVRCVAMDSTDGLRRNLPAHSMGTPIQVPVGPETLGRVFNVLGRPVDGGPEVKAEQYYPIHRPAPDFEAHSPAVARLGFLGVLE
jgi:F-type H+-transporting ATPase subunit beta